MLVLFSSPITYSGLFGLRLASAWVHLPASDDARLCLGGEFSRAFEGVYLWRWCGVLLGLGLIGSHRIGRK